MISPFDKIILNHTDIELKWRINSDKYTIFNFDVYFGESKNEIERIESVTTNFYQPIDISNQKTYYWQVVPRFLLNSKIIEGDSSPVWSFKIRKDYNPPIVSLINPRVL